MHKLNLEQWLMEFFGHFGWKDFYNLQFPTNKAVLWQQSGYIQSTRLSSTVLHDRNKNAEVDKYVIMEKIEKGQIFIRYYPVLEQSANCLEVQH